METYCPRYGRAVRRGIPTVSRHRQPRPGASNAASYPPIPSVPARLGAGDRLRLPVVGAWPGALPHQWDREPRLVSLSPAVRPTTWTIKRRRGKAALWTVRALRLRPHQERFAVLSHGWPGWQLCGLSMHPQPRRRVRYGAADKLRTGAGFWREPGPPWSFCVPLDDQPLNIMVTSGGRSGC